MRRTDVYLFFACLMGVTEYFDVCFFSVRGSEIQLTCRMVRVFPQGMNHDSGSTAEDTLQYKWKKQAITTEKYE